MADQKYNLKKIFACGCAVLLLFSCVLIILAYYGVKGVATKILDEYTETQPRALPEVTLPEEQLKAVQERVKTFAEAVKNDQPTDPLVLTADEINALIQQNEEFKTIPLKVYLTFDDDKLNGEISLPLDEFGSWFKGRYLNATASFSVSLAHDRLQVYAESLEVKGEQIPDEYMKEVRTRNLAEDEMKDPEFAAVIEKLEEIAIQDGKLIVRAKAP